MTITADDEKELRKIIVRVQGKQYDDEETLSAVAERAYLLGRETAQKDIRRIAEAIGRVQYPDGHAPCRGSVEDMVSRAEELTRAENTRDDAIAALFEHRHAALFAAGIHGGPGAWRWASDLTGTTLGDTEAWERLLGEMRERVGTPGPATGFRSAGPDGLFHDRVHVDKPETRPARSVRVKPRRPVASWVEEASGDTWALEIGAITAFVTEDCDGVRADLEVTGDDPITGTFQHNRKAAQLAAEDALRAIADQINGVLRGGQ